MQLRYLLAFWSLPLLLLSPALAQPKPAGPAAEKPFVRTFSWSYRTDWTWDMELPRDIITYYQRKARPQWNGSHAYYSLFIEPTDRGVRLVAQGINEALADFKDWSEHDRLMFVVSMLQQMPYIADSLSGEEDYTNYPIETLVEGGGDCEDKAILGAALLKRMGFDVKLVFLETADKKRSHVALGVSLKNEKSLEGSYWEFKGKKYFYLETTYPGWQIGEVPGEWQNLMGVVIEVL